MPRLSRMVLTLLLATLLVSTAAWAQSPARPLGPASSAFQDLFTRLWSFLTHSWSKNGCQVDPSGRCWTDQSTVQSKNGCELDPNGRCIQ